MQKYDIVIFGNYTKDTIVTPSGTRYVDGGGFNYGAHAAVVAGLKVAAVTRLAREDFRVVQKLRDLGVDVYPTETPSSTHMRLEYPTENWDHRILTCTATAGTYTTDQFDGLDAKAFLINGSIREEVPLGLVQNLKNNDRLLVADAQTFIRIIAADHQLVHAAWPEMEDFLQYMDVLKADAVEAESLTGEKDLHKAAKILSALGPKEIVLTNRDGITVYANEEFFQVPFRPGKIIGRSGRGDTCIASYMSARLNSPAREAIVWSAAVTSMKMQAEGPIVKNRRDVVEFIRQNYKEYQNNN